VHIILSKLESSQAETLCLYFLVISCQKILRIIHSSFVHIISIDASVTRWSINKIFLKEKFVVTESPQIKS
jgi:hypothetical protein